MSLFHTLPQHPWDTLEPLIGLSSLSFLFFDQTSPFGLLHHQQEGRGGGISERGGREWLAKKDDQKEKKALAF